LASRRPRARRVLAPPVKSGRHRAALHAKWVAPFPACIVQHSLRNQMLLLLLLVLLVLLVVLPGCCTAARKCSAAFARPARHTGAARAAGPAPAVAVEGSALCSAADLAAA
jgi:hypothetical protein